MKNILTDEEKLTIRFNDLKYKLISIYHKVKEEYSKEGISEEAIKSLSGLILENVVNEIYEADKIGDEKLSNQDIFLISEIEAIIFADETGNEIEDIDIGYQRIKEL